MQTSLFTEYTVAATAEWLVAEEPEPVSRVEEDGVDWCEWWAAYAETLE